MKFVLSAAFNDPEHLVPLAVAAEDSVRGELPRAAEAPAVQSMSVSSFRLYLQSPYEFYLKHVLRLKTLDDRARELDPLRFGKLAHEVEIGRAHV